MKTTNPPSYTARKLHEILQHRCEPLKAIELANLWDLTGKREYQRRQIRRFVKELRDDGCKIIATLSGGYWLTDDNELWLDYSQGRTITAKRIFAEASKRKRAVTDETQTMLFSNQ